MGGLFCPRCRKQNITVKEEELNISNPVFIFPRYKCSDCGTQFYFYENVIEYMAILSKMGGAKKT